MHNPFVITILKKIKVFVDKGNEEYTICLSLTTYHFEGKKLKVL
jgi:hypothetical protein